MHARCQPEATLGARVLNDVVSSTALTNSLPSYQAGEIPILSVAFARGIGLIAIERTDVGLLVLDDSRRRPAFQRTDDKFIDDGMRRLRESIDGGNTGNETRPVVRAMLMRTFGRG